MRIILNLFLIECIQAVYNIEQCDNCGLDIQTEIKCPRNLPQFCDFAPNCEAILFIHFQDYNFLRNGFTKDSISLSFHWCHTSSCLNHLLTDDVDCTVAIAPGQKLKSSISAKCSSNYECDGESNICQDTGNVVESRRPATFIVFYASSRIGPYSGWASQSCQGNVCAFKMCNFRCEFPKQKIIVHDLGLQPSCSDCTSPVIPMLKSKSDWSCTVRALLVTSRNEPIKMNGDYVGKHITSQSIAMGENVRVIYAFDNYPENMRPWIDSCEIILPSLNQNVTVVRNGAVLDCKLTRDINFQLLQPSIYLPDPGIVQFVAFTPENHKGSFGIRLKCRAILLEKTTSQYSSAHKITTRETSTTQLTKDTIDWSSYERNDYKFEALVSNNLPEESVTTVTMKISPDRKTSWQWAAIFVIILTLVCLIIIWSSKKGCTKKKRKRKNIWHGLPKFVESHTIKDKETAKIVWVEKTKPEGI
ncbi:Oidioi.mRNA.OKI2018_I69.chr2.g6048.t1.cds [Oikopleura dioica]|uniref:Oidioi.mRNA.OKI2018_I69.chr2.g6048.t1.cds n=1 Tax=Oikopleura dioica TaxID=34765 RepID=A0ABN7T6L9_OIKDI|nr:Oidioi.mRNA.OKI2018_I69.chr2.g6048.t1.cds [Oikopleura dioica]